MQYARVVPVSSVVSQDVRGVLYSEPGGEMIDKIKCNVCKHWYIFKGDDNFKSKFEHFIWSCEVLAEVEKCVSVEMAKALNVLSVKFSDIEKELHERLLEDSIPNKAECGEQTKEHKEERLHNNQ